MLEHFNGDLDAFAIHVREKGAHIKGPIDQPWNVREVPVIDPDGYQLIFTMPINLNLSFEEVIENIGKDEIK
jgi:hypothetical protein